MNIFSKAVKGIAKAAKNTEKAVVKGAKDTGKAGLKAVKDTGHVAGSIAKSDIGQAVIGTALAASGVGLVPAVLIGAGAKSSATLIAPHGTLKKAGGAAIKGAELGAGAAVAGAAVRTINNKTGLGGFRSQLLGGKNATMPVSPSRPEIRPISEPPIPTEMVPVTTSGITPPAMKVPPVEQIVDAVKPAIGRKGTPADTHKQSLPKTRAVVPDSAPMLSGNGSDSSEIPLAAPAQAATGAFNPKVAIAAVAAAILVGILSVRRGGR